MLCAQTSAFALWVVQLNAKLTGGSLWQWCFSDVSHCCSSRDDWLSVRVPESWLNRLSTTASQTVTAEDGRNNDEQGLERGVGRKRKLTVKLDPKTGDYTDDTGTWTASL